MFIKLLTPLLTTLDLKETGVQLDTFSKTESEKQMTVFYENYHVIEYYHIIIFTCPFE